MVATDIAHSPLALGGLTRGIPLKNLVNAIFHTEMAEPIIKHIL